jgi:hypothetical protein
MEVTGYQLREALKKHSLTLQNIERKFNKAMYRFADQEKEHPTKLAAQVFELERRIVRLQAAQTQYNLLVKVDFQGQKISLAEAVRLQGVAGRNAGRWSMYQRMDLEPDETIRIKRADVTEEHAKPVMTNDQVMAQIIEAEKILATLKGLIAEGNTEKVGVSDLADGDL